MAITSPSTSPKADAIPLRREDIAALIDERPAERVFRVNRRAFTDPWLFELEMRHLFEGGWVFLGLASQAPEPHDYFTTDVGRAPVVVMRDRNGTLGAFVNSCPHKGARICALASGRASVHVCPYHSWSFDSAGRNRGIKGKAAGAYEPSFDAEDHDLTRLPAFAEYRGLLFGSLVADVPALEDYLGEASHMLDLIVDQGEQGLELVPGVVTFTFEANWKLQLENCSDQYHFSSVHPTYLKVIDRRAAANYEASTRNMWDRKSGHQEKPGVPTGGTFGFANGHVVNWRMVDAPDALPLAERREELRGRVGEARCEWMFHSRNLTIFPNVQFAENASSQLRIIRPLAPGRTEMRTYCLAPRGESAEARRLRIRQYEDFFNPSGLATPDDAVVYEACQSGYGSPLRPWLQGYARGQAACRTSGNQFSEALGMTPQTSVAADRFLADETIFHAYYRAWRERLMQALT